MGWLAIATSPQTLQHSRRTDGRQSQNGFREEAIYRPGAQGTDPGPRTTDPEHPRKPTRDPKKPSNIRKLLGRRVSTSWGTLPDDLRVSGCWSVSLGSGSVSLGFG